MPHTVLVSTAAQRDFRRLPPQVRERIRQAMLALEEDARGRSQKLAGEGGYRKRVGDYRIVFRVDDDREEVLVTRIKHRRDVYRL